MSNEIFVLGEGKRGVQKGIFPASKSYQQIYYCSFKSVSS